MSRFACSTCASMWRPQGLLTEAKDLKRSHCSSGCRGKGKPWADLLCRDCQWPTWRHRCWPRAAIPTSSPTSSQAWASTPPKATPNGPTLKAAQGCTALRLLQRWLACSSQGRQWLSLLAVWACSASAPWCRAACWPTRCNRGKGGLGPPGMAADQVSSDSMFCPFVGDAVHAFERRLCRLLISAAPYP